MYFQGSLWLLMMSLYSKITHKLRLVSFLSPTVSQLVDMSLLSNQNEGICISLLELYSLNL